MGPFSAEVEIDVPRERVFELLSDLSLRPSFTDHFLSGFRLTRIDPAGIGAGARFRAEAPLRSFWMDTTIAEQEEPFRIVERGFGGRINRIPIQTVWEITPGAGSLSAVRVTFATDPRHPVDRALERLSMGSHWQRRGWKRAMIRLRDLLESEQAAGEQIAVAGGNRYATGIP